MDRPTRSIDELLLQVKLGSSIASIHTRSLTTTTNTTKTTINKQGGHPTHAFFVASGPRHQSQCGRAGPVMMKAAHTLYDFPVSNNGGRCRVVIYDKGVQDKFE